MNKLLLAVLVSFFYFGAAYGSSLSSFTMEHNALQVVAPKGMLQFILDSEPDDAQLFNQCIEENNLNKSSSSKLFIVSKANLTKDPNETYFVRPALEPYCMAFYGAHLFRYWFVKVESTNSKLKFTMLLQGGGDGITVLVNETKGHKDLSSISHTAMDLYTTTLKYNGLKYESASCAVKNFSTEEIRPCE
jgi:hypothetical protein